MYKPRLNDTHAFVYETETKSTWVIVITPAEETTPVELSLAYDDGTAVTFERSDELTEKVRMRIRVAERQLEEEGST